MGPNAQTVTEPATPSSNASLNNADSHLRPIVWIAWAQAVGSLSLLATAAVLAFALYQLGRLDLGATRTQQVGAVEATGLAGDVTHILAEALRLFDAERRERLSLSEELSKQRREATPPANATAH